MGRDPELVRSNFSGSLTRDAVTVRLEIYRLESDRQWMLGVVNQNGTSIAWDDLFDTDGPAYEAFEAAVAKNRMSTFLDEAETLTRPTRH